MFRPTSDIEQLLREGLDAALRAQVGKLWDVALTNPDDGIALERLELGLRRAVNLHGLMLERITAICEEDGDDQPGN